MLRSRTVHRIHELAAQGKSIHTIATTLGIARNTVRKYLRGAPPPKARPTRPSKLDPFKDQIRRWMVADHLYNCETMLPRLHALGYTGGISILKDFVHPLRPARAGHRPVRRYETAPGEQLQFDWAEFTYEHDGACRKLFGFTAVLSYSRMRFVVFVKRCDTATLIRCLMDACEYFGGLPRAMLTDRMRPLASHHGSAARIRPKPRARSNVALAWSSRASGRACTLPISTTSIAKRGPGAMRATAGSTALRASVPLSGGPRNSSPPSRLRLPGSALPWKSARSVGMATSRTMGCSMGCRPSRRWLAPWSRCATGRACSASGPTGSSS